MRWLPGRERSGRECGTGTGGYIGGMFGARWARFCGGFGLVLAVGTAWAEPFTFTILHTNDLHSHHEPTRVRGKSVGGYARQASVILKLREESVNPILLNAGDVFQGTMYFNVYEGLSDLAFMNMIGYQAMAVGNHEFDKGPGPLATFARLAKFPVLSANLDLSKEPSLKDLIRPSTVIEVEGEKVGVVGTLPLNTLEITSAGPTVGMLDYRKSVQAAVDDLTRRGVDKVVLLSHAGFETDLEMAKVLRGVDVVVGGHSHTLLGEVEIPDFQGSRGPYPVVVTDAVGQRVLVVQAWEWGKVVGRLQVTFDEKGVPQSWEGGPVLVDESWPENPFVASMMAAFRMPIEAASSKVVAQLETDLSQRFSVEAGEPLMGNVIADAVLDATKAQGSVVAFWNAGGVRAALEKGSVTYGALVEVCPFGNTLVVMDVTGAELLATLEHGVSVGGMFLPSRGFSYGFDPEAAVGSRLRGASLNGAAIEPAKVYRITVNSFIAAGGDGHVVLRDAKGERRDTGFVDIDALLAYFEKNSPVRMSNEGRIRVGR